MKTFKDLKIEAGKFYRTRDGRKAGIYRTDVNHPEYSIHGYVIDSDGVEYSLNWRSNGRISSIEEFKIDLIEEWKEPLDFDWDCLPKWRNAYIAMDEDGGWYAFSNEPKQGSCYFYDHATTGIPKDYQPKNFTGDWTDSLFKNPNLD